MAQRVEAAERLLDLVIALTHTPRWMTKQQIRSQVNGYADAASAEAFERMFERDKDLLRELGVPLVLVRDPAHDDDLGYRVDTEGYTLPPVSFTPAEVGVLSLAAEVWQDAALHASARRAMTKLRAVGPAPDPGAHTGLALRVRGPEPAFGPLLAAIDARQAVTFTYRAASTGQVTTRTVEPWRILSRDRGWYLLGRDTDRQAPRAFRLSRIQGRVRPTGPAGAFTVPADVDVTALLPARSPAGLARLAVLPDRAAALRARAVPDGAAPGRAVVGPDRRGADETPAPAGEGPLTDRDLLTVPFSDLEIAAEEIATYADGVLVLDPPELRAAVVRRLRAVTALDDGDA
ncbi:WYL domain-containing protein [Georgenia sp. TF02-10]|uniref:helix-turn-helix transcriptional regulator n=1 Tax=Georgenia sp. TF02-10 TaxID=2917725 RepID=UPI001FA6AC11|nr:WYL domain-containing protein [Georgenia sp. TF02-10]UNX53197.1 WYL domain-containing protein [Georgenia sp. TF02-10]